METTEAPKIDMTSAHEIEETRVHFSKNKLITGIRRHKAALMLGAMLLVGCGRNDEQKIFISSTPTPDRNTELVTPESNVNPLTTLNSLLRRKDVDPENTDNLQVLNDLTSSSESFSSMIDNWEGAEPIFPNLSSDQAKIRFVDEVLRRDDLDSESYIQPDYGSDVNGDGVIEITTDERNNTRNEEGEVVDMTLNVCVNFAQELVRRYGINQEGRILKPGKYWLPMFQATTSEGHQADQSRNGRGHGFNSIYLGQSPHELQNPNKWYFIEPQTDQSISQGVKSGVVAYGANGSEGTLLEISAPSIASLGINPSIPVIGFAPNEDGTMLVIEPEILNIIREFDSWVIMQRLLINPKPSKDEFVMDEPDLRKFTLGQINRAVGIAAQTKFIDPSLLQAAYADSILPSQ